MQDHTLSDLKNLSVHDHLTLAKSLTRVEKLGPKSFQAYPELLNPTKKALRLGITGPPGAGKSTLIGGLISSLRAQGKSVGVLAIDPSSPFSRGAILGDRIRYSDHFNDEGVFIRSLGTRGSLGGLCASAYLMLRVYDLAGFDVVLIETVGVGQTELEIMNVADKIAVVLVPESGDSVQAMKAGLLEIADIYVVNKADRPGADALAKELQAQSHNPDHQVIQTVATENKGVDQLVSSFFDENVKAMQERQVNRLQEEAKALLRLQFEEHIEQQVSQVSSAQDLSGLFK